MYSPRHARSSCLPVRAAVGGGLTAVLLPIALAAPALATEVTPTSAPASASASPSPTASQSAVADRSATSMRISASGIAPDGTSRIGVRLLTGDRTLAGETVAVEVPDSTGWTVVARLTTDAEGLAVGHLPFSGQSRVRAVFAGTASHASSTSPEAPVRQRTATQMRISASQTGGDNRSRIGVRLLSGGQPVRGLPVAIEMLHDDGVWRYHGQATTDGEGLAVAFLPFGRDTQVRAGFSGSDTAMEGRSGEALVTFNNLGEQALRIAAEQQGKPYRYGATGPSSFDCSGFVSYIYKTRLGKNVPRTSAQQEAFFPRVPQSAKRPGDLLFFRTGGRVSHVGVYAGGNKMWASPSTGDRVKLQTVYTSSYTVGRIN